ncbi:MAG: beta-ketoacyl-[acyl-carrier-protein] synthase family protein [Lentisphaerae bacterium]|nr:beta-ketoacyl-[acyl-carrier-protein] synthase family protein [Lentisphaerota bacterium]
MTDKRRVVVTGMGVVTSVGLDIETFWKNMVARKCGIRRIQAFDVSGLKESAGAEIDDGELLPAFKAAKIRPMDRAVDMGVLAAGQALEAAGAIPSLQPDTATDITSIVACHGSWRSMYEIAELFFREGPAAVRPSSLPRFIPNAASAQVSMRYKLSGANYVVMSACSSGTAALGAGYRTILHGYADAVICAGTDCLFDPLVFNGWSKLGVMSSNPDPQKACRPFDAARDGCVLGEGAGAILLESEEHARARGVTPAAEMTGYGDSSDASHITRPEKEGQARAITAAMNSAGISASEVGFISAHGTATRSNDTSEAAAIRIAMGAEADRIPVVSHKSYFGHLLGACGVVETIVCILGMNRGGIPANINLDTPDPECQIVLPREGMVVPDRPSVVKNTFGFGGNNCVAVFKPWQA